MKRTVRLVLLGVVVYVIAVAATLPAQNVYAWFGGYIPTRPVEVRPYGLTGTVWNGRAESVTVDGTAVGRFEWNVRPLAALMGRASLDWALNDGEGVLSGTVSASPTGTIAVSDVRGRIPVARVTRYLPFLPVVVDGLVSVNLEQATLSAGRIQEAKGTLVWNQARVVAPQEVRLGDLRVQLTPRKQGGIAGAISDGGGPLEASGALVLEPDGKYRFQGRFASRDPNQPVLAQALRMIGQPDRKGGVRASFSGSL